MWPLSGKKDDKRPELTKEQERARYRLWKNLGDNGWAVGDLSDFSSNLDDGEKLQRLYTNLGNNGWSVGDYEDFAARVGYDAEWDAELKRRKAQAGGE